MGSLVGGRVSGERDVREGEGTAKVGRCVREFGDTAIQLRGDPENMKWGGGDRGEGDEIM